MPGSDLSVSYSALLGSWDALLGHVIAGEALTSIQFLGFALALTAMTVASSPRPSPDSHTARTVKRGRSQQWSRLQGAPRP